MKVNIYVYQYEEWDSDERWVFSESQVEEFFNKRYEHWSYESDFEDWLDDNFSAYEVYNSKDRNYYEEYIAYQKKVFESEITKYEVEA